MGYFFRPEVFSILLVILAWIYEMKLLRSKDLKHILIKILGIAFLMVVSIVNFVYFYTDTILDAFVVFMVVFLSCLLLASTIPILNTKIKFQHTIFFITHWCVAIVLTGTRAHLLIAYPSYLFGTYFLLSMTYYLYRSKARVKIMIMIGILISLRFVYAYELDFSSNNMISRGSNTWSQYQVVEKNKPTKLALNYFYDHYEYSTIHAIDALDSNPKKSGVLFIIHYDYKLFMHTVRLTYFEGEIKEE